MARKQQPASEQLTLRYIPLSQATLWDVNPKKHDIGAIAQSIAKHGFKDPAKFEPAMNNGQGGLVEGNGRAEALGWMQAQGQEIPRGIAVDPGSGEWHMPVVFGVDADSQDQAEAYAIDHNNLVMGGGDFTAVDMMGLWEEGEYTNILRTLAQANMMPISVGGDDLDLFQRLQEQPVYQAPPDVDQLWQGMPEFEQPDARAWKTIYVHFLTPEDYAAFGRLVGQRLTEQTRYIYYPEQIEENLKDFRVVADDEDIAHDDINIEA